MDSIARFTSRLIDLEFQCPIDFKFFIILFTQIDVCKAWKYRMHFFSNNFTLF